MKTNPNEPLNCNNGNGFYNDEFNHTHAGIGLTKREYFAAMAMQGTVMANDHTSPHRMDKGIAELHARAAVTLADALIAELNKETSDG